MLRLSVPALAAVLLTAFTAPADARQRGGVVDVIPPEEVERIIEAGSCTFPDDADDGENTKPHPNRRNFLRAPHIPDSIATYWSGKVTVLMFYDLSADGEVVNSRIARYTYQDRARHFSRGQRRALEPELLAWLALPTFEDVTNGVAMSGCKMTLVIGMD